MVTAELGYECSFLIEESQNFFLFHVTRHDAGHQRALRSPSLEESILNFAADYIPDIIKSSPDGFCPEPPSVGRAINAFSNFHPERAEIFLRVPD
ncbi:hypothetical protein TNCV_3731811 [Trichonephila clavipes]|nr:hypothetical protein TNCV_3731811 [Trichonephila clavipes]